MKKRIISALLCLIMVFSLVTTAFAGDALPETKQQETTPQTGTLTIRKVVEGVAPAQDWAFRFTIRNADESVAAQTVTVTVDHKTKTGETVIRELPFGAYTVTEDLSTAKVDGYALTAGSAQFVFKAYLDDQVVGTSTIQTNGVNSYAGKLTAALTDKQLEAGTVKLTVREEKSAVSGWQSDTSVYTLTVALVDDRLQITDIRKSGSDTSYGQGDKSLEFTNTYTKQHNGTPRPQPKPDDPQKPDSPKTGDAGILPYAAAALTALGGGVMLVSNKRRLGR